jgi:ABC-type nitrate/sulfonate/bicarbonate transport system permease component
VKLSRATPRLIQLGVLAALIAAWHLATKDKAINPLLLPPLTGVWRRLTTMVGENELWSDLAVTLNEVLTAFALATILGCTVGFLVSRTRFRIRVFDPLFSGLFAIPAILVYPLYVLFFGLGPPSKIAIGTTIAFFPIVLNTIAGFGNVDSLLIRSAYSMGANSRQMFFKVLLPAAAPVVMTGLRIGFILAFLSILGSETIAALEGLGHRIAAYAESMSADRMFATIVFVVVISFLLNWIVSTLDARLGGGGGGGRMIASSRRHGDRFGGPGLTRLGIIIGLLILWEVGGRWFADPLFFRPLSATIDAAFTILADPKVARAVELTFIELAVAFVLSVIFGLVVGLAIGLSRFAYRATFPVVLMAYATPQVTILPLVVLWFGIGAESKIVFGFTHGIFPIIVSVVAGVRNIDDVLRRAAWSMGASRMQILWNVVFPHMMPAFFTGMRLAMAGTLLGVLLAELYVSQGGIGYYTAIFTQTFSPDKLFALIGTLAIMAICLNELARRAELHFSRWQQT